MSLNKRLCLRSDSQNSDSFSERIADNLCEVILQYLPLKDKHRLEYVSKQFQKTVFQRQYELTMSIGELIPLKEGSDSDNSDEDSKPRVYYSDSPLFKDNSFDLKSLESLLKKCPNIRSIKLTQTSWLEFKCKNFNEFIALITKYCNNLVEFKCPLSQTNDNTFNEFNKKFGQKLKAFKCFPNTLTLLKTYPNLEELELNHWFDIELNDTLLGLQRSELKSLIVNDIDDDIENLKFLLDNCLTVRHLVLSFENNNDWDIRLLRSLSNLNQLIHLKIDGVIAFGENFFFETFKEMAENCLKLKSIDLTFDRKWRKGSDMRRVISALKTFKQLKRLKLRFDGFQNEVKQKFKTEVFSFEAFEGLSNITHLSLAFDSINEEMITNIDNHLPNLQYLELSRFSAPPKEATHLAHILSRLSKLETIELKVSAGIEDWKTIIGSKLQKELIQKCRKFRRIDVNVDLITD